MRQSADTLIRNAYVITVDPDRRVLTDGYVAFTGGRISAVGRMADCAIDAAETIDARGRILMPGMANTHNHLVQVAFRGYNDERWPVLDIPLAVRNLLIQLFAMAGRMDAERTYAIVRLHALDMLKSGYTATHDEHFTNIRKDSVDGSWQAIADSGMRGFLARCIVSGERVPDEGAEDVDAGMAEVERLRAQFSSSRIEVVPGILNYQFLRDPQDMVRIVSGARAMGARIDVDMTDNSRGAALKARGFDGGQVEYYRSFGLLDAPLYAGKAHALLPHEFDLLTAHDGRVSMVPMLRFFDGQGLPVHEWLARGVLPGLGTDAPMVTDCQNPFEMMRHLILGQNLAVKHSVAAGGERPAPEHWVTSEKAIEMATLGGARTLFMDDHAGSIEVGKAADCVLVDLDRAETTPDIETLRRPGILVWAGAAANVDTVFVDGRKLIEGGRSTIWNEDDVMRDAAQALHSIAAEAGIDALLPSRRAGQTFRGWRYE